MQTKKYAGTVAAFCGLFFCILISGCVTEEKNAVTGLEIAEDGTILYRIVETFDKEYYSTESLKTMIDENLDVRTVIAHGHSHPNISPFYQNFSLKDLASYVCLTEIVEDFKLKNMQLVGCLVLPEGQVKFAYFNPSDNKFYDFEKIEIE